MEVEEDEDEFVNLTQRQEVLKRQYDFHQVGERAQVKPQAMSDFGLPMNFASSKSKSRAQTQSISIPTDQNRSERSKVE